MMLKCKMCGGDLNPKDGATTCECEYCGSVQTIPVVDDERIASMYNKANALRQAKEFDKAQMVYESIMEEKPKDAEACWGAALCHFGIEYVEDPYSHERKPTLHRMQYESILADRRYLSAIEKADAVSADLYQQEAGLIDRILKRYQAISAKEQPFDVFICYKETEIGSRSRTRDSVYAQEIYDALTKEGYHVFFSRITLEDKLGEAYEPYIFAALNTAKVMLVVGTSRENIESDWVQNEWRRYLFLMQKDNSKKLIPVYRDMDAYELPEEFVYLQSQDYSKIGALQDLVRGVEKIVGRKKEEPAKAPHAPVPVTGTVTGSGMLERAFLFLEDGNFDAALERVEKVLDQDPKNAKAYLAKLMITKRVRTPGQLANLENAFEQDDNYRKLMRFGDEKLKEEVSGYLETINHRKEQERLQKLYDQAAAVLNQAKTIAEIERAKKQFEAIANFRDARAMMEKCDQTREDLCEKMYQRAVREEKNGNLQAALSTYRELGNYRDSRVSLKRCEQKLAEEDRAQKAAEEQRLAEERRLQEIKQAELAEKERQAAMIAQRKAAERKRKAKRNGVLAGILAAIAACGVAIYVLIIAPMQKYNDAVKSLEQGRYSAAILAFTELGNYRDSAERIQQTRANGAFDAGEYETVGTIYASLDPQYQDHAEDLNRLYQEAEDLLAQGKYDEAIAAYTSLGDYREAAEQINECIYRKAKEMMKTEPQDGVKLLGTISGYKDSYELLVQYLADELYEDGKYAEAWEKYASLPEAYHTHERDYASIYAAAEQLREEGEFEEAIKTFSALGTYEDAAEQAENTGRQRISELIAEEKYGEVAEVYEFLGDQEHAVNYTYLYAKQLAEKGEYREAAEAYTKIIDYEDSREQRYLTGLQARQTGQLQDAFYILSQDLDYRDAQEAIYQTALSASGEQFYEVSVPAFVLLGAYKDSAMKVTMDTYAWGAQLFDREEYEKSAEVYESMGDFSDAADKALEAKYAAADGLFNMGEYASAVSRFTALGNYKDSEERAKLAKYHQAVGLMETGEYETARDMFLDLKDYEDAKNRAMACAYKLALKEKETGEYNIAAKHFDELGDYGDSETQAKSCRYVLAQQAQEAGNLDEAIELYLALGNYEESLEQLGACYYQKAEIAEKSNEIETAYSLYLQADSYQDAVTKAQEMAYSVGVRMSSAGDYEKAVEWLEKAGDCQDSEDQILNIAEYYYSTSQYEDAERIYTRIAKNATAQKRLYELGQYYELVGGLGNLKNAARIYRAAGEYEDAAEKAQEVDYQRAVQLMAIEKYEAAKGIFSGIRGYKDVDSRLEACESAIAAAARAARLAPFKTIGGYATFGSYEQDNNTGNGKEEIEWLVLDYDETNQRALLLSRYGLDAKPYHTTYTSITWEDCTLRKWLNQDFLRAAFTSEEQQAILLTNVRNTESEGYIGWSTSGGNNTQDKVFLLSYNEAFNKYFSGDSERQAKPTAYAKAQGAYTNSGNGNCWWWLRSPGDYRDYAADVSTAGSRHDSGVDDDDGAVRPALWLDLTSDIF